MKMKIEMSRDLRDLPTVGGDFRAFAVAGESRAHIEIDCGGPEALEIVRRLQGMDGVPVIPVDETSSPPTYSDEIPRWRDPSDEFGEDPGALPEPTRPEGLRDWNSQKARMISMSEKELDKLERGDWGTNWKKAAIEFRRRQKNAKRAAENRQRRAMAEKMKAAERAGVAPENWIPPWERKPQGASIDDFDPEPRALDRNFARDIEID